MAKVKSPQPPFEFGGQTISAGTQVRVDLPLSQLSTHTPVNLPVQVIHGKRPGPRLFVSAAVHGDEINGVEIIRRLLQRPRMRQLHGTLVAIPIVNVYGFIGRTRYLPDRRDLNRSFPGSDSGSLAAQLAHLFMTEIVGRCTHGIDLHTGSFYRHNLPQIRANLDDPEVKRLARAFGVPVILHAKLRDGSLREAANDQGVPLLLYEAGEALRFDEKAIRAGVDGIGRVMEELGMLPRRLHKQPIKPVIARTSTWARAPVSGILRAVTPLGARVEEGERIGAIADPLGDADEPVESPIEGVVIGRTTLPVINQGDALVHIARVRDAESAAERVEQFHEDLEVLDGDQPDVL